MTPYEYQQQLLKNNEETNNRCIEWAMKLHAQGLFVISTGTVYGPFVTYITYHWSNGLVFTFAEPSKLVWADFENAGYKL